MPSIFVLALSSSARDDSSSVWYRSTTATNRSRSTVSAASRSQLRSSVSTARGDAASPSEMSELTGVSVVVSNSASRNAPSSSCNCTRPGPLASVVSRSMITSTFFGSRPSSASFPSTISRRSAVGADVCSPSSAASERRTCLVTFREFRDTGLAPAPHGEDLSPALSARSSRLIV